MTPVLWFCGLSGSGKTTLANELKRYLDEHPDLFPAIRKWEILDGDELRSFLGSEVGYSLKDRRISVRIVGLLAKCLGSNGIGVLVANISPFQDIRAVFREQIAYYFEIYCKCSIDTCIQRDPKGHYSQQLKNGIKDYVGLDIPFEPPEAPALIIETDHTSVQESRKILADFVQTISSGSPQ